MLNSLHSNSLIVKKDLETDITFNPFEVMGVAFLSVYNLDGGKCKTTLKLGNTVLEKEIVENCVLIDFSNPIILEVGSRVKLKTSSNCFVHYHIFVPSVREQNMYIRY